MRCTSPKNNTCILSMSDVSWIYKNLYSTGHVLIEGLARRRYQDPSEILSNPASQIRFFQKCMLSCESEFKNCKYDMNSYRVLQNIDPDVVDLDEFEVCILHLWRGFSEENITLQAISLDKDKLYCEERIAECLKANGRARASLTRQYNRKGARKWLLLKKRGILERDKATILSLRSELTSFYQRPLREIAFQKLLFITRRRRHPALTLLFPEDDYAYILYKLEHYSPKRHTFPLRFMEDMPWGLYSHLFDQWELGKDRDQVINMYLRYCENDGTKTLNVIDQISNEYKHITNVLCVDRTKAIEEIQKCEKSDAPHALLLLGVSLLEGLIWDYAVYLNRRNFRIFKPTGKNWPRGYPYKWDETTGKVILRNGRGEYDKGMPVSTGRDVLGKTRLGYFVPGILRMYIMSDFFDDRNYYAHGNYQDRDVLADSYVISLCLMYLLKQMRSYIVDGVNPNDDQD